MGKQDSLTLAEKHWLHAALSLMGFGAFLEGVGNAAGVGEHEDGFEVDKVVELAESAVVVVIDVVVALASVNEYVSVWECK